MRSPLIILSLGLLLSGCLHVSTSDSSPTSQSLDPTPTSIIQNPSMPTFDLTKKAKSATIKTNLGDITVELYADKAPTTVANFAALSEGSIEWTNPKTGQKQTSPLYNDVVFHRIIKDFMIQGGDPLGTGTGGPGYKFQDEIDPALTFSEPYFLAMANSGPNTNGSQFFITTVATPWLNGKHTIFGKVTKGQEVVDKIENSKTDASDRPVEAIVIKKIEVAY